MATLIDINGRKLNDAQLVSAITKLVNKESQKVIITGKDSQGNKQFAEEYQKKIDLTKKYLSGIIAANISSELLGNILDNTFSVTSSTVFSGMKKGENIITKPRIFEQIGIFLESALFGYAPNRNPLPDIQKIQTEIKATTAENFERLAVGDVSVHIDTIKEIEKINTNLLIAYKMAAKMQNLLLIKMEKSNVYSKADAPKKSFFKKAREWVLMSGEREKAPYARDVRITQIGLHMFLLIKKLWEILEKEAENMMKNKNVFDLGKGTVTKDEKGGFYVRYNVQINVKQIENIEGFLTLYAYHTDLLREIKTNDGFRKSFWAQIDDIRGGGMAEASFSDIEKSFNAFTSLWGGDLFS